MKERNQGKHDFFAAAPLGRRVAFRSDLLPRRSRAAQILASRSAPASLRFGLFFG
jgi:hypothetical protein